MRLDNKLSALESEYGSGDYPANTQRNIDRHTLMRTLFGILGSTVISADESLMRRENHFRAGATSTRVWEIAPMTSYRYNVFKVL